VKASSLEQKCRYEGTVAIDSQILSFRSRRRRNLRHHGVREATSCLLHHKHHRGALAGRRPQKKLALVEMRNLPAWTLRRTAVKTDCDAQADSSAAFGFGLTMYDKQRRWPYLSRMTGS
jgi:hypothetical protein